MRWNKYEVIIIIYLFITPEGSATQRHHYKDRRNTRETKNWNTQKLETIKQITQQMKPWCVDQFTTVFSNDFRVYSLISKSRVDGSGLFIVQTVLPCVPSTERSPYRWLVIVARDGAKCRPIINCLFVLLYFSEESDYDKSHAERNV